MKDFKGYSKITAEDLINAAGNVYRDDPLQRNVVIRTIMDLAF